MTLHAAVIVVTANQITATGSPVLSSDQGIVQAPQFSISLDRNGRAESAQASGGVQFRLQVTPAPARSVVGSCSRIVLFPASRRVELLGGIRGILEGAGQAPVQLTGAEQADILAAMPGRPFRMELSGSPTVVAHT